ncbi:hypothetical protein [Mangrovibacterium diazotrophicum]|uniref:Uncharacterized protein n=1 Tax=Mangrovibacterium diazotrophicum TaxID=1261403 RepID=A0A419VVJ7_9BACT|nr:hypothetical protein [Mangrovibacterium diazotrophicum]RKD86032.1 hypothetical protein BC643_4348 [Mangrovibacterium diazotrophicum]
MASSKELYDKYLVLKQEGMSFGEIRSRLASEGVAEEDIRVIIRLIDNQILRGDVKKSRNQKARELIAVGLVISVVGIIVTLGTYLGYINTGNSYLVAYGPVLGGAGIAAGGWSQYNRKDGRK